MGGQSIFDWEYIYDPLNRLTEANYSTGDYYHYAYDAVGNRETQSKSVLGFVTNDTYVYDNVNRLTSVNAVNYTWDNNGNLLNDGVNTYTYDSANRLKGMSNQSTVISYQYNGLNDRLREIVNGSTTTFTTDLNAGLTQALNDGTKAYIYGNGRIAQVGTGTEYFLGDALGSVRQMTQGSGTLTYAKAYDPYGVVTSTTGSAQSAYGYTGEFTSQGLVYLRARMYAPGTGRFLTRDAWSGDYNNPLTLNAWNYTSSDPINYLDPSGHYSAYCNWILGNYLTVDRTGDPRDLDDCWTKMPDGQYVRNPWCQVYVFEGEHRFLRIPKEKSPLMQVHLPGILILMTGSSDDEDQSEDDEELSTSGTSTPSGPPKIIKTFLNIKGETAKGIRSRIPSDWSGPEFDYYSPKSDPSQHIPQYKFISADGSAELRVHGPQKPYETSWVARIGRKVPEGTPGALVNPFNSKEFWLYYTNEGVPTADMKAMHIQLNTNLLDMIDVFRKGY